ncbi:FabD/lysophospholipase-like protein [Ceratobasidium sp. AG-I]|nr:FabD/lysophospholipase-like protein [Ceratobasidium sp. AG-I]
MINSPEERGLRILSLDGGGVSVLSALNIVGQAMDRLKVANELPVAPRPCETFDFMSGTGMGAVAVILLGRLRLDTVSATKSFMEISERTFLSKKRFSRGSVFSAKVLEKVMGELVTRHCGQADAKMLETDSSSNSCKVMVCASTAHALRAGIPTCIRTYVASANQGPDCTVVEAVRATTATPGVFKQAVIQEQGVKILYVGGGLQCNNPTDLALREVSMLFPGRPISCVMSVGAGQLRSASIPNVKIYDALLPSKLAPALERIATDCERTHQDLARRFEHTKGVYFRFSTDQGMQDIDQYDAKRLSEVQAHTRNYLHDTLVTSRMDEAIHSINAGVGAVKITRNYISCFNFMLWP